jgi:hypothetical protein
MCLIELFANFALLGGKTLELRKRIGSGTPGSG